MNLGSASENLAIGIALYLRDGFTPNSVRASNSMRNMRREAEDLARQQATLARNTNAMGAAAGGLLLNGIGKAYQEYSSFNYLMKFTALAADDNTKALDALGNKALEVGKKTIFSSKDIAEAMRWLAQAGLTSQEIVNSIDTAAHLAAATMSPINGEKGAADMLAKITTAFQIPKTPENMARVGDILAIGANKSLTDLVRFGEGMTYAQTTAMRLKMTLEETTAAIMMLSNSGIQGTVTGTTLDNMERYLADAAGGRRKKATAALAMMGLGPQDLQDAQGNLLPLATILSKLSKGMQGLGTVAKNNIAIDIFGVRGAKGTLLMDNLAKYDEFLKELQNNKGYAKRIGEDLMDSDQGAIDKLKSNWESLKIQFGESVAPLLTPLLKYATTILDTFSKIVTSPVGGVLAKILTAFIIIKTAQMAYRAVLLTIRLTQGTLGTSMATTAATTATSFGTMTGAANSYSAALVRLRMMGTAAMGVGSIGQFRTGQYYQVGPGGGYIPLARGSYKPGLARANRFASGAMLPAMIGGMALGAASESAGGNETGWGRGLGVAGDTLTYASMGAMVGSIIPGVGTAVGGIVGGVYGLLSGLHNRLKDLNSDINEENNKLNGRPFDKDRWLKEVKLSNALKYGDRMYNMNGSRVLDNRFNPVRGGRDNYGFNNSVTVIIDGKEAMNKQYTDNDIKEIINLAQ